MNKTWTSSNTITILHLGIKTHSVFISFSFQLLLLFQDTLNNSLSFHATVVRSAMFIQFKEFFVNVFGQTESVPNDYLRSQVRLNKIIRFRRDFFITNCLLLSGKEMREVCILLSTDGSSLFSSRFRSHSLPSRTFILDTSVSSSFI